LWTTDKLQRRGINSQGFSVVILTLGVAAAARARQDRLTKPPGSLGRLEDLSVWVASCQGLCPPRQFQRPRVVVFAGDHGVTSAGVSAYPAEVTAQMVANFDAGGAAINVLAEAAGASVRVAPAGSGAFPDARAPIDREWLRGCVASARVGSKAARQNWCREINQNAPGEGRAAIRPTTSDHELSMPLDL